MNDVEFLALLVHRGHLPRERAETLVAELRAGAELDGLLARRIGWDADKIQTLRRTRAGEIPEIPGYEMLAVAGRGGTATVLRARDKRTRRIVALKVLSPECTAKTAIRRAFVEEARLLERLDHPGLVKGLGIARSGTTYFMRQEFIEGSTLLEMLDGGHVFGEESALRIVLEVAEVLVYLEQQELVHRDIKPGNVMIGQDGRVKLIDLGFAAQLAAGDGDASGLVFGGGAAAEREPSDTDSTVGTVAYLSPEQARGAQTADARSDIYSLGVSLFHIAVGRLPFESSDDREVLRMQIMDSLRSPELKSRGFSHYLQYFIGKMMAKDAEDRYQSWRELIDDIRSQLEGRESLDFRRGKPTRRRP